MEGSKFNVLSKVGEGTAGNGAQISRTFQFGHK